jgi:hypothetical protein
MKMKLHAACVAAAFAFGLPGAAFAEDTPQTALTDPETSAPDAQVDMAAIVDALVAEASTQVVVSGLSDDDLGEQRGGQSLTISNQTLTAISTGSVLNGNYTAGAVSISDNALSNFNGFGNVLINTGAQNNLQSGMNLTINVNN